jgi:hypothetical protein
LIEADILDTVHLHDCRFPKELPDNPEATALYHRIRKPGTTHRIKGEWLSAKTRISLRPAEWPIREFADLK